MAKIDDLMKQVADAPLRRELETAVAELKKRTRFGLVYENHLPEMTALPGLPITEGAFVVHRAQVSGRHAFRVCEIADGQALVEPLAGGQMQSIPAAELIALQRFGEPIYPGLELVGTVARGGPERAHHAVINAENYHAAQLLLHLYEGQVDCLYLDPPYNTGARDWTYNNDYVDSNDAFRHSKWLSFMEKRLRLAKRLLKPDGVLIVAIDENEHSHLGVLLEELFPQHEKHSIAIVHNPRGIQGTNFSYINEAAYFVIPANRKTIDDRRIEDTAIDWRNLRDNGGESLRSDARNCFYGIIVENDNIVGFTDVMPTGESPNGQTVRVGSQSIIYPVDPQSIERKWRYARQSVNAVKHLLRLKRTNRASRYEVEIGKNYGTYRTVWQEARYDANEYGKKLVNTLVPNGGFDFPKSLYNVYDCIAAVSRTRPNALIVDFFAGSGTTLHATCLLNAEDDGRRRCILVTNNEVGADDVRTLHAQGHYKGDAEYEKFGIFQRVTRPRCEAAITGSRPDGTPVPGTYIGGRPMADGFAENVTFFQLNYLDPDRVDMGQQFAAIAPLLWLQSEAVGAWDTLTNAKRKPGFWLPPEARYGVCFRDSAFGGFCEALHARPDVTHAYLVTNSEDAFTQMRAALPSRLTTHRLYRDYLRSFRLKPIS